VRRSATTLPTACAVGRLELGTQPGNQIDRDCQDRSGSRYSGGLAFWRMAVLLRGPSNPSSCIGAADRVASSVSGYSRFLTARRLVITFVPSDYATRTTLVSASIIGRPVGVSSPSNRGADSDHAHAYEDDECAAHQNTSDLSSRRSR
jgi:hypothetical protein